MKLYVPQIGDRIQLIDDWTFDLYNESRNLSLLHFINDPRDCHYSSAMTGEPFTVPVGSILKIDRIYIRKGLDDFSSMTFFWEGKRVPAGVYSARYGKQGSTEKYSARPIRFWAKMTDVNKIEFDFPTV